MNTISFMTGLLTFYLKGEISVEQNFLNMKTPNTILALIPLGSHNDSVPVQQLSSVSCDFRLGIGRLIWGIFFVNLGIIGFGTSSPLLGLIFLIVGVNMGVTAFQTVLNVSDTSGKLYSTSFLIFEKDKAYQAERMVRGIIANRLDDTNTRQVSETQTAAINQAAAANTQAMIDAINNMKNN